MEKSGRVSELEKKALKIHKHTMNIHRKVRRIMDGNLCRTIRLVLAHSQVNVEHWQHQQQRLWKKFHRHYGNCVNLRRCFILPTNRRDVRLWNGYWTKSYIEGKMREENNVPVKQTKKNRDNSKITSFLIIRFEVGVGFTQIVHDFY